MARRSFEPILDLREPVSDGPCACPMADFGSPRESLTAGAGRPPYTGGSGSSPTRRSGPLLFLLSSSIRADLASTTNNEDPVYRRHRRIPRSGDRLRAVGRHRASPPD